MISRSRGHWGLPPLASAPPTSKKDVVGPPWLAAWLRWTSRPWLLKSSWFEETTVALSLLCKVEIDLVERALNDRGHDIILILSRLAGFSWTSAKAILLLKCADRGISAQDLDGAMHSYANLQPETARRVLDFYHTRLKACAGKTPVAARA